MQARILEGAGLAAQIRSEVARAAEQLLQDRGIRPKLTAILVGDDPASHLYVSSKRKACAEVGIESDTLALPATTSEPELLSAIRSLGEDRLVHGILLQLPLPPGLPPRKALDSIPPEKDVDGLHPLNVGKLALDLPGFAPCTPAGIIEVLRRSEIPLEGRNVVIVGRSQLVGRPLLQLLLRENATVTVCHSRTQDLAAITSQAQILIAAIGKPAAIGRPHIRPGAVVIDVGTNEVTADRAPAHFFAAGSRTERLLRKNGKVLVGDVDPFVVQELASAYTPVPGGIGPMTIAMLLQNTLRAAREAS